MYNEVRMRSKIAQIMKDGQIFPRGHTHTMWIGLGTAGARWGPKNYILL